MPGIWLSMDLRIICTDLCHAALRGRTYACLRFDVFQPPGHRSEVSFTNLVLPRVRLIGVHDHLDFSRARVKIVRL